MFFFSKNTGLSISTNIAENTCCVSIADDNPAVVDQIKMNIVTNIAACRSVVSSETGTAIKNDQRQTIEHVGFVDGRSIPLLLVEDIQKENITI
jgi:deferrochelatase/peroxidase EfeB